MPSNKFLTVNKIVLICTIVAIAFNLQKGSFSRYHIPNLFQILMVLSVLLTFFYLLKEHKVKDFFNAIPKKILIAIICFYGLIFIGWAIAIFYLAIPTTLTTILDFGTFTMGIILFFLVSFYSKGDQLFARRSLYAILIPNVHLLYYFLTHGWVGYWGVTNDFSLDKVLDPNILSKTLLVPTMFFISLALFSLSNKNKKWWTPVLYGVLGILAATLVFWTISRGAAVSLLFGAFVTWVIYISREFTWKKFFIGGIIVLAIISVAYSITPRATKQATLLKTANTFTLPASSGGSVANVTVAEIQKLPQTESRLIIWHLYPKYILQHPFGVGPNSSHDFNFHDKDGVHIYFGPDSTYLIIGLWGGLLGLAVYFYIVGSAFAELLRKLKRSPSAIILALFGILFTLTVALFFDGMLSLYCFYIILALSFQYKAQYDEQ
ncbi:MAG: O-antigen ligase family protein [Candidatus Paceibacterota bacterium]